MSGAIEALYIHDEHSRPILQHTYTARPLTSAQLLPLYLAHPEPRPSLIYLPNTSPSTLLFNLKHANLLFFLTSTSEIEPLLALEVLHRIIDVLEEFLGSPLLAQKIESNYDVVAQLLNEMCDAGAISTTEPNALRDLVEVEGWIGKLLGGIQIPGSVRGVEIEMPLANLDSKQAPSVSTSGMAGFSSTGALNTNAPSLPWRRANVRHTSNEMYVDIIESLSVTIAPSGRPLVALASGTIAFTSKLSGVPDLQLTLSTPSGKHNFNTVMELPVFHPCVRLARWRENPGELSFIPPDGRFVLAGYEVDLLPFQNGKAGSSGASNLKLPVSLEVKTGLGPQGSDFEVRLFIQKVSGSGNSSLGSTARSGGPSGARATSAFASTFGQQAGTSATPALEDLVVTIPLPEEVRNLPEIRPSRGDTAYSPGSRQLDWSIPAKEAVAGGATLRCTVAGPFVEVEDFESNGFGVNTDYDEGESAYQNIPAKISKESDASGDQKDARKIAQNRMLMPSSANVSFSVRGWLASGIKVESLTIDSRKSRGMGESVKPYKGVKYLTVSSHGVELRC